MINIKSNHDILYKSDRYFNAKLIIIFHPYFWFQNLNFFVIDLIAKIIIKKKTAIWSRRLNDGPINLSVRKQTTITTTIITNTTLLHI